jgi:hypothetical protein
LHRHAFGAQAVFNGRKVNKLERMEAYGPYRVLELQDKGRLRVELRRDWSNQKTNVFSLQHVRWFYNRRPWEFDQISLEQHLAETWSDNREYEVAFFERVTVTPASPCFTLSPKNAHDGRPHRYADVIPGLLLLIDRLRHATRTVMSLQTVCLDLQQG